jgi:DNA-binding MarR family transcriptional regulator
MRSNFIVSLPDARMTLEAKIVVGNNKACCDARPMDNPLNDLPGYALRRAAVSMMAELTSRLEASGIRYSETAVILLIGANPGIAASTVGRELEIQRANLTRILGRLEEEGLLGRELMDGKSHAVALTPAGRKLHGRIAAIVADFERSLLERIPDGHRQHLLPALQALWR